ncbi:AAA family ATPase [Pannonibacter tanglangensis]|uniref:AAA family ATPase n=1 Tax=Pannonibacter tanglangensis TaxID=2750084 RepID=A0ABW9ZMF4_9HYPH|nr:AAA family ATPase [Pannonibacter sp. XCT-34]NBN64761.1 AAA family ATPase [Pannonibacter sp. XCT-34]
MADAGTFDFAALARPVALELYGEPNARLSSASELRFGSNGSLKVAVAGDAAGTFSDFEAGDSGGLLALVARKIGGGERAALDWLRQRFGQGEAPRRDAGRIVAVYAYQDEDGRTLFEVVRKEPKTFLQRKSASDYSVKGVRVVPYRLPHLIEPIALKRPIFIVEGEKDADRLAALGAPATCNAGGAGKWRDEHSAFFSGADVIIIPDNDRAGEDHADKVARSLKGIAARVRILRLMSLDRKGDVSDWLDAGGRIEQLYELAEAAPDWRPASKLPLTWLGDEDRVPPRRWLVKGLLGQNELSIIHAPSGGGKSFFALDLSARIAAGLDWFDHQVMPCPVLYVAAEGAGGFRLRMKAWRQKHPDAEGAPFVMLSRSVDLLDPRSDAVEVLTDAIAEVKDATGEAVGLIVLDTLSRMMPGGVDSEPRDVKAFLENTERLRTETAAHVMIIHHSGKETDRGMRGSSMLRDYADTVIEIKGNETDGPLRAVISKQKDGEDGHEFRFNLLQSTIGSDEDGDDITSCVVDPVGASAGNGPEKKPKLSDREEIARRCLADLLAGDAVTPVTGVAAASVTRAVTVEQWRDAVRNRLAIENDSTFRVTWKRIQDKLLRLSVVGIDRGLVWLALHQ